MTDDFIDYGKLIDDAMHVIVKKALEHVKAEGLPGKHHFFISFLTHFPGVELADHLRRKYPDEMTIVLQHQFEGLEITDSGFCVNLSFDNVQEKICVPFDSMVAFADPSVKFGLQFRHADDMEFTDEEMAELDEMAGVSESIDVFEDDERPKESKPAKKERRKTKGVDNVISLDSFRKK